MNLAHRLCRTTTVLQRLLTPTTSACKRTYCSAEAEDINDVIYAGIVVKKQGNLSAWIQHYTGQRIPIKATHHTAKEAMKVLELGMNVLVKGSLDQERVVRQVKGNFKPSFNNFIDAKVIEVVPPDEIDQRKEERRARVFGESTLQRQ